MLRPLLSICIPTFNRLPYLQELIESLAPQISAMRDGEIELVISNNASTDGTGAFCEGLKVPNLRYWENEVNIGGDKNFLKCIRESRGEYTWLIGDDDLIAPDAVSRIIKQLKSDRPGLLIASEDPKENAAVYPDYRTCLLNEKSPRGVFAIVHTLISANIFRRELFDLKRAEETLWTQYAHMFGLIDNLKTAPICVIPSLMKTRPVRADFAKYPSFLCIKHAIYLWHIAKLYDLPRYKWLSVKSACNLPMEFGSRIKYYLLKAIR